MKSVPLGDVSTKVAKWKPRESSATSRFTYIDLSSIDRSSKSIAEPKNLRCIDAPSRARQLVVSGDVLVSTVSPDLNAVAWVPTEFDGATASTGFCVMRPRKDRVHGRYLFHWVRSPRFIGEMSSLSRGAIFLAVSDKIIKKSAIPLPPLEEQRRIAAILDAADALRTKRRQALAKLDTLSQAIFANMFGDPRMTTSWPEVTLGELAKVVTGGTPRRSEPSNFAGSIPWVKIGDMHPREVTQTEESITKAGLEGSSAKLLAAGTLLISIFATIGRTAVLGRDAATNQAIAGIIIKDLDRLDRDYLRGYLERAGDGLANQSRGVAQANINLSILRSHAIPLPPMAEQRRFARLVGRVDQLRRPSTSALDQLDNLFAALQQRAFRGEL